MRNVLWYLGFLSLLSVLSFKGNWYLLGFLGFLPYFLTYWAKDERVDLNVGKAARNAFLYTVALGAVSVSYISLTGDEEAFRWAFTLLFSGCILLCVLSFFYYDLRGDN